MPRITTALTLSAAALTVGFSLACYGGASLDGNDAGSDGWLDHTPPVGAEIPTLADDGRCDWLGRPYVSVSTERVYTMLYSDLASDCDDSNQADQKVVYAVHPAIGAEPLVDVSGRDDVRLLDTSEGLLLMGESGGHEHLWRIDHDSLAVLADDVHDVRYWGTRTSPSRRWVAAGDNNGPGLDLHLVDPRDLESIEIDESAAWAEAMWMKSDDRLATIFFDAGIDTARIELWDFRGVDAASDFPTAPLHSTTVSGVSPHLFGNYTWIGVDPSGRYTVFPVHHPDSAQSILLIQDTLDGSIRTVTGVDGPLRFTPDGSTIVGWSIEEPGVLKLVDPVTLDTTSVALPFDGMIEYVMGYGGNQLLVASAFGGDELVLYDLDLDETLVLPVEATLQTFTTRLDQVWMVDSGRLIEVDMLNGTTDTVDLDWTPRHVVWAPVSDQLYLDDAYAPRARFMDPETRAITHTVVLNPGAAPTLDLSVEATLERDDRAFTAPAAASLLR